MASKSKNAAPMGPYGKAGKGKTPKPKNTQKPKGPATGGK